MTSFFEQVYRIDTGTIKQSFSSLTQIKKHVSDSQSYTKVLYHQKPFQTQRTAKLQLVTDKFQKQSFSKPSTRQLAGSFTALRLQTNMHVYNCTQLLSAFLVGTRYSLVYAENIGVSSGGQGGGRAPTGFSYMVLIK